MSVPDPRSSDPVSSPAAASKPIDPAVAVMPARGRVLVIRLGAVGDVVRALAAVGLLRAERSDVRVGWLVEEPSRLLVEGNPAVDEVFVFERRGVERAADLRRRLRAARFDVALDLQGTLKGAAWTLAVGARRRVGFTRAVAREGSWLLGGARFTPPHSARSRLDQFVALVRALGVEAPVPDGGLSVPLPPLAERQQVAARWVAQRGLDRKPWAILCPGSSAAQAFKRWPAPRFAEAGRRLAARGVGVVIGWGPGEEALAEEIEAGCAGGAVMAPGGDLLDLTALISQAAVFVGNDSGPMHLAWAVRTPVVAIFGPTDPALNAPPGPSHRILYEGPPRRPGERRLRRQVYLDRIRPAEVEGAVLEIVERAGTPRLTGGAP